MNVVLLLKALLLMYLDTYKALEYEFCMFSCVPQEEVPIYVVFIYMVTWCLIVWYIE